MSLHDRIKRIPRWHMGEDRPAHHVINDAAKIAEEADELMAEMAEALTSLRHEMMESGNYYAEDFGWPKAKIKTNRAIEKYNAWKETTT